MILLLFSYILPFDYLIGVIFIYLLLVNMLVILAIIIIQHYLLKNISKFFLLLLSLIILFIVDLGILPANENTSPFNEIKISLKALKEYNHLTYNDIFKCNDYYKTRFRRISAKHKFDKNLPDKIIYISYHPTSYSKYYISEPNAVINKSYSVYFNGDSIKSNNPKLEIIAINKDSIILNDSYFNEKIKFVIAKSKSIFLINPKTDEKIYFEPGDILFKTKNIDISVELDNDFESIGFQKLFEIFVKMFY